MPTNPPPRGKSEIQTGCPGQIWDDCPTRVALSLQVDHLREAAQAVVNADAAYDDALDQQYPGVDIDQRANAVWDSIKRLRVALDPSGHKDRNPDEV